MLPPLVAFASEANEEYPVVGACSAESYLTHGGWKVERGTGRHRGCNILLKGMPPIP